MIFHFFSNETEFYGLSTNDYVEEINEFEAEEKSFNFTIEEKVILGRSFLHVFVCNIIMIYFIYTNINGLDRPNT